MSLADTFVAYYLLTLIPISFILGLINLSQLYHFHSWRSQAPAASIKRFLETRKPALVLIYGGIAVISSVITLPFVTFVHTLSTQHSADRASSINWLHAGISSTARSSLLHTQWVFEFTHEISTCFLLLLIAIRSWCLYYDYQCAVAKKNQLWRAHIDEKETYFWLQHQRYLGNYRFIVCVSTGCTLCILFVFIILHLTIGLRLLGFMADFTVAIPICVCVLWINKQIRHTDDPHKIKDELQRLCVCVGICGASFLVWIVKEAWIDSYGVYNADTVDIHMLMYTADIVFTFFTVYFQTQWVMQQAVKYEQWREEHEREQYSTSGKSNLSSRSFKELKMVDVLRSKQGFAAFVNHCVKEMNVEGIVKLHTTHCK